MPTTEEGLRGNSGHKGLSVGYVRRCHATYVGKNYTWSGFYVNTVVEKNVKGEC